jgi:hypothetical protein
MPKANPTPGPWCVHPHFAYVVPLAHAERPIGGAEDDAYDLAHYAQEICALHMPDRHRSEDESYANARLIAAAPDLLKALESVRDWVADAAERKSYFSQADASIVELAQADLVRIDAALSKTRGQ